jgi:hypothetical protein
MVMDNGIAARQRRLANRDPAHQCAALRSVFAWWRGPIRKPPEKTEAERDGDDAVDEEHPLEADEALGAVHFLETGGYKAHDCGGDLGCCEVLADAFADARRWVE